MANGASRPLFWSVAGGVVLADFITKVIAVATLSRVPVRVIGDAVTFQLVYNPGAAFGINVGEYSRWVFMVLALLALFVLGGMVRQTDGAQWVRLTALAAVCGGAVGNLIDRVRSPLGVVDFIDVGIGSLRWPTFNVADAAVTCGAITLAVVLWAEGRHDAQPEEHTTAPVSSS